MDRIRSIAFDSLSWLLAGTMLYLGALRFATEATWPIRLIGYAVLLIIPFALIRQVSAGLGAEIEWGWLLLPIFLSGFIPRDSAR